jgi:hypothetical protein
VSVLDRIDSATLARRTVEVILNAELEDKWLGLKAKLLDAANSDVQTGSLAQPATTAVVNDMEDIREQVEKSKVFFVFEQMDWTERIKLQVQHPPRDDNRLDQMYGFNHETYTPAIIRETCAGAHDGDEKNLMEVPEERWAKLLGDPVKGVKPLLNYAQVNRLYGAAHRVNEGEATVPMSARSLLGTRDSGASLAQPSPGADPAPSGSTGGSRRTSRKSSTTKKAASRA